MSTSTWPGWTCPGVTRIINIGLLEDEDLKPGDWVLIHVGFAMSKIDEEEAALALASLQLMGQAYDDELENFQRSGHRHRHCQRAQHLGGSMRFVDEYRDPTAARALVAQITELAGDETLQIHGSVRGSHPHDLPARD
jgi:hydrogenase expression/formation protein HypC